MFLISTVIGERVVTVATRPTRDQAEAYVASHANGCLPELFITDATPSAGTHSELLKHDREVCFAPDRCA